MVKGEFEIIVRAVIIQGNKILVCQTKGRDYFFLPGGHIKFSEGIKTALSRELDEEIGVRPQKADFIGGMENTFEQDEKPHHEFNFVFEVEIEGEIHDSKEDHLTFYWFDMDQFIDEKFAPEALRDAVLKWMADKVPFFIEEKGRII